jgi:hypothetical protein
MRSNIDANLEATGKFLTDPAQATPSEGPPGRSIEELARIHGFVCCHDKRV